MNTTNLAIALPGNQWVYTEKGATKRGLQPGSPTPNQEFVPVQWLALGYVKQVREGE